MRRVSVKPVVGGLVIGRPASRRLVRERLALLIRPIMRSHGERTSRRNRARRRVAAVWSPHELEAELRRSRRYEHTFALVRIPSDANAVAGSTVEFAQAIGSLVRSVDKVWSDAESVYVLLPEGDRAMSEAMLTRLGHPLAELLSAEEQDAISSVVFPQDGVTSRALLDALHRKGSTFPDLVRLREDTRRARNGGAGGDTRRGERGRHASRAGDAS